MPGQASSKNEPSGLMESKHVSHYKLDCQLSPSCRFKVVYKFAITDKKLNENNVHLK